MSQKAAKSRAVKWVFMGREDSTTREESEWRVRGGPAERPRARLLWGGRRGVARGGGVW